MIYFRFSIRLLFVAVITSAVLLVVTLIYERHQENLMLHPFKPLYSSLFLNTQREPTKNAHLEEVFSEKEDFHFTPPKTSDIRQNNFQTALTSSLDAFERRRSLLIFGADRSGTTFISRMFSEDPQVFMIYEPLWVTKRWRTSQPQTNWTNSELEVLNGILSCNFPDFPMATQFLAHTSRNWAVAPFKNPFESPNFCNVSKTAKKSCPNLFRLPKFAQYICATRYKHSVTKVAQVRVPDKMLSSIVPQVFTENPDTDIRIIQILRDPRGSLDSRIKRGWMPNHTFRGHRGFLFHVKHACEKTTQNVQYARNLTGKYREKYMEVYYRDMALNPVKTALKIYKFAGFEIPENVIKWIVFNTNPSREELARELWKPFSSVRNSTANIEKWRRAPAEQNRVVEDECEELMQLIGIEK